VVFAKRIDATESYHAGMTVQTVARMADKDTFAHFTEQKANADSGNPRYKVVRKEQALSEAGGLWKARSRVDFEDSGAVNVGKREMLATEGAHFFAMNPKEPERLITVWFSRRSAKFDEGKFAQEAERFFASFR